MCQEDPHAPEGPDVSSPEGLGSLVRLQVKRRTLGCMVAGPALAVGLSPLEAGRAEAGQGTHRATTRGAFAAMVSEHFGWVHSSLYRDPYKNPQPTFVDVQVGTTPHAMGIETALEEGVVGPAGGHFHPAAPLELQDAADMLARAFRIPASGQDLLSRVADADLVSASLRPAVNGLLVLGVLTPQQGRLSPRHHVGRQEAVQLLERVASRVVAPAQAMCKPGTTAPRRYVALDTPTDDATVHYEYTFDGSEPRVPDTSSPSFDLRQNGVLQFVNPLDSTTDSRHYRLRTIVLHPQLGSSAVRDFEWMIVRPRQGEWRHQVVHEGAPGSPRVVRINNPAEYFQANVYYLEGSTAGLVFDAGEYSHERSDLKTYIDGIARRPYQLVLGHNHPDHVEQIHNFTRAGITCHMSAIERASLIASSRPDLQEAGRDASPIEDGARIDLGDVQVSIFHAPGHTNGLVTALVDQTGWVFASDHFGCNRPYTADTTQYNQMKVDRFLSLQRQLLEDYRRRSHTGGITEVTNAHQDQSVGQACVDNFVECFQRLVDDGPGVLEPSIRGGVTGNPTGPVRGSRMSKVGDMWRDRDWMAIGNPLGGAWGSPIDIYSAPTTDFPTGVQVDHNTAGGYLRYAVLSNVVVDGGELQGVDLHWAAPANGVENRIANKFDPWTHRYTVKVPSGRRRVTVRPTAMARAAHVTVNGRRVPWGGSVSVRVSRGPIRISVVAPDRVTRAEYVLDLQRD